MTMNTEYLDAAWFLAKGAFTGAGRADAVKHLAAQFPELQPIAVEEAIARAAQLEEVSCECVDEMRGPKNDWKGSASRDYRAVCPGFSEAVYQDASPRIGNSPCSKMRWPATGTGLRMPRSRENSARPSKRRGRRLTGCENATGRCCATRSPARSPIRATWTTRFGS
jgi:hypothetical protein